MSDMTNNKSYFETLQAFYMHFLSFLVLKSATKELNDTRLSKSTSK